MEIICSQVQPLQVSEINQTVNSLIFFNPQITVNKAPHFQNTQLYLLKHSVLLGFKVSMENSFENMCMQ